MLVPELGTYLLYNTIGDCQVKFRELLRQQFRAFREPLELPGLPALAEQLRNHNTANKLQPKFSFSFLLMPQLYIYYRQSQAGT